VFVSQVVRRGGVRAVMSLERSQLPGAQFQMFQKFRGSWLDGEHDIILYSSEPELVQLLRTCTLLVQV
jgi:hypothetical protein